jgi:signal transduction histidine kinase/putative methionine-R-sulfoxide reductase with GAF domain
MLTSKSTPEPETFSATATDKHQPAVVMFGFSLIALALFIIGRSTPPPINPTHGLIWLESLGLFTLAYTLRDRVPQASLFGLAAVAMIWLMLDLSTALSVVLLGGLLTIGLNLSQLAQLHERNQSFVDLTRQTIATVGLAILTLLAASLIRELLPVAAPAAALTLTSASLLAGALFLGHVAAHLSAMLLNRRWRLITLRQDVIVGFVFTVMATFYYSLAANPLLLGAALALTAAYIIHTYDNQQRQTQLQGRIEELTLLYASSSQLASHLSTINKTAHDLITHLDRKEAWQKICQSALTVGQAQATAMFTAEPRLTLKAAAGELDTQRYANLPHQLDPLQKPLTLADVAVADSDLRLVDLATRGDFQALTVIPLLKSNNQTGYLVLFYDHTHTPGQTTLDLLNSLVSQGAIIINNGDLFEALEIYAFEMAQLAHLARISASTLNLDEMSVDVAQILCKIMDMNQVAIALIDEGADRQAQVIGGSSIDSDSLAAGLSLHFPELDALIQPNGFMPRMFQADEANSPELTRIMAQNGETSLAVAPIRMAKTPIGLILLGSQEPRRFSQREWQLVETATNQLAPHIQNARLYTRTRQELKLRLQQLALIEDVARRISSSLEFNQIIGHILDAAAHSTQADLVSLAIRNEMNNLSLTTQYYQDDQPQREESTLPNEMGVIGHVLRTGKTVMIPNNQDDADYLPPHDRLTYQSSMIVPLIQHGEVIGALNVESLRENFFRQEHADFLNNLAGHAVISIANARLLAERQYQVKMLVNLQVLANRLSSVTDRQTAAEEILTTCLDLFEAQEAILFHHEAESERVAPLAARHEPSFTPPGWTVLIAQVALEAAQTGEIQIDQSMRLNASDDADVKHSSVISVPLKRGDRVEEVLSIAYAQQHPFPRRDLNTLALLASQAIGYLENAALNEQIRSGNNRMSTILRSTRDGVILLDQHGKLIVANPAAHQLLQGKLDDYIRAAGWQTAESTADNLTRRRFEHKSPTQTLYIDEIGTPVADVDHQSNNGYLLVLRDATEEETLATYRDEVTQMVIHDLRGPLASIISGIRLVQEEMPPGSTDESIHNILDLSAGSAESLMNLIESLMDVAKLEAQKMPLNRQVISFERLVLRANEVLASSARQANIDIQVDLAPDLAPIFVDAELIQRVVINLLDNALQHTPLNGKVSIAAQINANEGKIEVQIADSGSGIPPEHRQHIFEKFGQARGKETRYVRRGTGLGLTFCKLAVEAHSGRIWIAENSPLSGACFVFTLPVASETSKVQ